MRVFPRVLIAGAMVFATSLANASPSLELVIDLAKTKAYRSRFVDWNSLEREARALEEKEGEKAAIRFVISALADKHTFYVPPAPSTPKASQGKSGPREIAVILPPVGGVPVLQINGWSGSGGDTPEAARTVRSRLDEIMRGAPCGLILDFSENHGGTMWPMLMGLSPLLSEGKLGAFHRANGNREEISKSNGAIALKGVAVFPDAVPIQTYAGGIPFIAISIGAHSGSSGEITPLMFLGQKGVKYFGARTAGLTSANQVHSLPNEGTLVLTTSIVEDRNGQEHPDGLDPDFKTEQPLKDASEWIAGKCAV